MLADHEVGEVSQVGQGGFLHLWLPRSLDGLVLTLEVSQGLSGNPIVDLRNHLCSHPGAEVKQSESPATWKRAQWKARRVYSAESERCN